MIDDYIAIGVFMAALVPTFLVSRLLLLILRKWDGGYLRLVVANLTSLMLCTALGSIGWSEAAAKYAATIAATIAAAVSSVIFAFLVFALPQLFWLAVDVFRLRRRLRAKETAAED